MSLDADLTAAQRDLDAIFHAKADDAYPAGCQEHSEIPAFVCKLHALRKSNAKDVDDAEAPVNPAAEALGLPSSYDPRFRVNVSITVDTDRLHQGVRALKRRAEREQGRGQATSLPPQELVEAYRSALPYYEDFYQRKQLGRLRKLAHDRAQLPISAHAAAVLAAVQEHPVVVIAGDTGCGKSTQVPQILLSGGFSRIVCTQPRRISAIALARRVSYETLSVHGDGVAYKVRFQSTMSGGSKIIFMTEGILLRMLSSDPMLSGYDVVIVDEVHERHLNTDFLLALLRALVLQRPLLRIILMSATINFQAFADYFGGAPVIQVPGRLYPIQLEYCPPPQQEQPSAASAASADLRARGWGRPGGQGQQHQQRGGGRGTQRSAPVAQDKPGQSQASEQQQQQQQQSSSSRPGRADGLDPAPYLRLLQRIDAEVPATQRGDLLVFVSGMADILALLEPMKAYAAETRRWVVLPLHSALSADEQDRVFDAAPEGARKVIISTNIAETSVTIDGIRFVADSGRAKEMQHDWASGGGSLQEGWISKASAEQRKGRAGRTGPGRCFRMYSQEQYDALMPFALPEVQRARLEGLVLQIKSLAGSGMDPRRFGFIDPPPQDGLESAIINLKQAGALSWSEELTSLGAALTLLPVDVHIGKLLVLGCLMHIPDPVLTIAAALSVQSPFLRLNDDDEAARAFRKEVMSPHGDAITLLLLFESWLEVKAQGRGGSARWCKRHGLQEQRLYEMAKLKAQFQQLLVEARLTRLLGSRRGGGHGGAGGQGRTEVGGSHKRGRSGNNGAGGPGSGEGRLTGSALVSAKRRLRDAQAARDRERGSKVLTLEGNVTTEAGSGSEDASDDDDAGAEEDDLRDLDLRVSVDVDAMFAATRHPLTRGDLHLLKFIVAAALYPRFAVGDAANRQRREPDCRFSTATSGDLVLHPASSLAGSAAGMPSQELLVYSEMLETRRTYLCGCTPVWALPAALLVARSVDCDAGATRWLVDGWLLFRIHDGSGAKLLELVCRLRNQVDALLTQRLRGAKLTALLATAATATASDQLISVEQLQAAADWQADVGHAGAGDAHLTAAGGAKADGTNVGGTALDGLRWLLEQCGGHGAAAGSSDKEAAVAGERAAVDEARLAQHLALAMEWPIRHTVERLQPGALVTAQYLECAPEPEPEVSDHPLAEGDPSDDQPDLGPVPPEPAVPPGPSVPPRSSRPHGYGGSMAVDGRGVPKRKAGVALSSWLQWGSLRGYESGLALHRLQPLLRKHWQCPGCSAKVIGLYSDVEQHIAMCDKAQRLDQQQLEAGGYAPAPSRQEPDAPPTMSTAGGAPGGTVSASSTPGIPDVSDTEAVQGMAEAAPDGFQSDELLSGLFSAAALRLDEYMGRGVKWGRRNDGSEQHGGTSRSGRHDEDARGTHLRSHADDSHRARDASDGAQPHGRTGGERGDADRQRRDGGTGERDRAGRFEGHRRHDGHRVEADEEAGRGRGRTGNDREQLGHGRSDRSAMEGDAPRTESRHEAGQREWGGEGGGGARGGPGSTVSGVRESHRTAEAATEALPPAAGGRAFVCSVCGLRAVLTPPQILRHRQTHAGGRDPA